MITLLVMTDGRDDYLNRTITAFNKHMTGPITRRVIHDDTGDLAHAQHLATVHPEFYVIGGEKRLGFGRAIHNAWTHVALTEQRFVFHLEDDFEVTRPVDLTDLATVLDDNRHLTQIALRRQPWNDDEKAKGGVVESNPTAFTPCADDAGRQWLEHWQFFTTNPCLYRTTLTSIGWPDTPLSEGVFSNQLRINHMYLRPPFAYYGPHADTPWVQHIGINRAGGGY